MSSQDIFYIIQWWIVFFGIGAIFSPLTFLIFDKFHDRGYLFSKVLGLGLISYFVLVLNIFRILPFNLITMAFVIWIFFLINANLLKKLKIGEVVRKKWRIFLFEELLFFVGILFWSYIRSHEPTINGLEKFMDFGFLNSIIRSDYQPAVDMWFPPFPINYYYFGHFTTAILTKLSLLPSFISYNIMLATIFSFAFSLSFSLISNLISPIINRKGFLAGVLGGLLVAFGGNLHTLYSLFKPYNTDNPVPFWNLIFSPSSFPNSYWYPNATRFIPLTIHEFPIYSFVVADLHGHVIDIIYVLLIIALAFIFFNKKGIDKFLLVLISFFLSIMYMTNAWDGLIYLLLISLILMAKNINLLRLGGKDKILKNFNAFFTGSLKYILPTVLLFIIFSIPFSLNFKPFASSIGILCAPSFLTKIGRIGPFLFEASHCQRSAWWQLLILYGFFYFFVLSFLVFVIKTKAKLFKEDFFIFALILISTLLIVVPEFIYLKDIYPAHYRANTMFKLVYQSFIMLSLSSAYIIFRIISNTFTLPARNARHSFGRRVFFIFTFLFLILVMIYPYFAVKSFYGDLKNYSGLNGIAYLKQRLPEDYEAIKWLDKNIKGRPVILEAQGDSYTDYGRISANTGLPTILGWTVHEWLWRGSYDIPAPRIADVKNIYESTDSKTTSSLLRKHDVKFVYVGKLEREKYPSLFEIKFEQLGNVVFKNGETKIYKIN